jgi:hypothetical protein
LGRKGKGTQRRKEIKREKENERKRWRQRKKREKETERNHMSLILAHQGSQTGIRNSGQEDWRCDPMVEHLPSMHKVPGLIPSTEKKNKKEIVGRKSGSHV